MDTKKWENFEVVKETSSNGMVHFSITSVAASGCRIFGSSKFVRPETIECASEWSKIKMRCSALNVAFDLGFNKASVEVSDPVDKIKLSAGSGGFSPLND